MKLRRIAVCALMLLLLVFGQGCGNSGHTASDNSIVKIAVIDTGISSTAISVDSLLPGKNYILTDQSTEDLLGHGTAVASIIVGSKSAGIEGLCPEALLIPMVIYSADSDGKEIKGDLDMVAKTIRDAIDIHHCDIINISFGDRRQTKELQSAIEYAEKQGVLVVSSVGNNGSIARIYPASYESVLCVGSLNAELDGAAQFSNRNELLDVVAPGIDIPVAAINGTSTTNSGTSFSAAYVTGLCARLMKEYPNLTAAQIQEILCTSAVDVSVSGFDKGTGWGAVDLTEALKYAKEVS